MKKILLTLGACFFILSCAKESVKDCGKYNGNQLYKGEKGGCYYYQSDGDKTYVDRKHCKC